MGVKWRREIEIITTGTSKGKKGQQGSDQGGRQDLCGEGGAYDPSREVEEPVYKRGARRKRQE